MPPAAVRREPAGRLLVRPALGSFPATVDAGLAPVQVEPGPVHSARGGPAGISEYEYPWFSRTSNVKARPRFVSATPRKQPLSVWSIAQPHLTLRISQSSQTAINLSATYSRAILWLAAHLPASPNASASIALTAARCRSQSLAENQQRVLERIESEHQKKRGDQSHEIRYFRCTLPTDGLRAHV